MKIELTQEQLDATIRQLEAAKVEAKLDATALFRSLTVLGENPDTRYLAEKRLKAYREAAELVVFFLHQ